MVRVLGHRQTKGAATDHPNLPSPRHISTLQIKVVRLDDRSWADSGHAIEWAVSTPSGPMLLPRAAAETVRSGRSHRSERRFCEAAQSNLRLKEIPARGASRRAGVEQWTPAGQFNAVSPNLGAGRVYSVTSAVSMYFHASPRVGVFWKSGV